MPFLWQAGIPGFLLRLMKYAVYKNSTKRRTEGEGKKKKISFWIVKKEVVVESY